MLNRDFENSNNSDDYAYYESIKDSISEEKMEELLKLRRIEIEKEKTHCNYFPPNNHDFVEEYLESIKSSISPIDRERVRDILEMAKDKYIKNYFIPVSEREKPVEPIDMNKIISELKKYLSEEQLSNIDDLLYKEDIINNRAKLPQYFNKINNISSKYNDIDKKIDEISQSESNIITQTKINKNILFENER